MNKKTGKIFVKWSKGIKSFWIVGNALEFAATIRDKYGEEPFIFDEI